MSWPTDDQDEVEAHRAENADTRIREHASEIRQLRRRMHESGNRAQATELKLAEVQLALASQDKSLEEIKHAVVGNGKPGLTLRVDRLEAVARVTCRLGWLIAAPLISAGAAAALYGLSLFLVRKH